ncbi:hypothetical protein C8R43DRAFT_940379 [Mycena crocata]|nr:hypothetical protein C8R43DRAFT_940379 [Mycena crocata]
MWMHPPNNVDAPIVAVDAPTADSDKSVDASTVTVGAPTIAVDAPTVTVGASTRSEKRVGAPTITVDAPTVTVGASTGGEKRVGAPIRLLSHVCAKPRGAKFPDYNLKYRTPVTYLPLNYLSDQCIPPKPNSLTTIPRTPSVGDLPATLYHKLRTLSNRSTLSHNPPDLSLDHDRSKPVPIPNFKKEGKGAVYINGRRRRRRWMRYRSGRQNHLAALRALEVKVGHTNWLPRRVTQYRGCRSDAQNIVWYGYLSAQCRMHVERRVHMALERRGIHPVRGECAGDDCNTDHKEYFPMLLIRRFSRLLRIVREEMVIAQEVDLKFTTARYVSSEVIIHLTICLSPPGGPSRLHYAVYFLLLIVSSTFGTGIPLRTDGYLIPAGNQRNPVRVNQWLCSAITQAVRAKPQVMFSGVTIGEYRCRMEGSVSAFANGIPRISFSFVSRSEEQRNAPLRYVRTAGLFLNVETGLLQGACINTIFAPEVKSGTGAFRATVVRGQGRPYGYFDENTTPLPLEEVHHFK